MTSRRRQLLWTIGAIAGVLVLTQLVFPGRGGGRGTPAAIVFDAIVFGSMSALTAAGLILVYRTVRVINFAQTAFGAAGATLVFQLLEFTPVPFPVAFVLGVTLAACVGLMFDLVFGRRFFRAPRLVLTVLTVVAAGFLGAVSSGLVLKLPFFPPLESRGIDELLGGANLAAHLPFAGFSFTVGDLPVPFGFAHLLSIEIVVITLVALAAFFRYTRAGVAVRAMAENADRATLLGISVGALSSLVWAIAGLLSGISVTLSGIISSPVVAQGFAPELLLPGLAAAVIARMRSIPIAVGAAVGISVLTSAAAWSFPSDGPLIDIAVFLVIAVGLLMQPRRGRADAIEAETWEAAEEQRPIPAALMGVGSLRFGYRVLIGVGLIGAGLYPFIASTGQTNLGAVIAITTIVAISLVVLTGWAGQVSLGHFAFVAVGAIVGGALSSKVGLGFWLAVPLATVITGGFAAMVGLPALRIRGLYLAVATFAFAVAASTFLFDERYFSWLLPNKVDRPSFFFLNFDDERSMYFLCLAALVLAVVVVVNLRRSRFGRTLIALRENEVNLQSFGIDAVRTKLGAFAVSGALAGFAGALFVHQQRGISAASFTTTASIDIFVLTVIGGIGSIGGALLGSAYVNINRYVVTEPILSAFLTGGGTLVLLYVAPGGLVSLLNRLRDSLLRIVAQRRGLVVPSLFAQTDAMERRLIPMAPPSTSTGLRAVIERFTMPWSIHDRRSEDGPSVDPDEAAISQAAERADEAVTT